MKVYSDKAWAIASKFSSVLGSETRDLAALIDEAYSPAPAPTGDSAGPSDEQVRAAIIAFWKAWPSFRKWWVSIDDGYGGKMHVDCLPPEPFEAAISAFRQPPQPT